jgi:hypothetical protein
MNHFNLHLSKSQVLKALISSYQLILLLHIDLWFSMPPQTQIDHLGYLLFHAEDLLLQGLDTFDLQLELGNRVIQFHLQALNLLFVNCLLWRLLYF